MRTFQPPAIADESRLSTDDLDRLRHRLVAESATHAARHAEHLAMAGRLRELTDPDSVLERELAEGGAVRAEEAMADIEDALRRIHTGTYGSCEACGTAIAL